MLPDALTLDATPASVPLARRYVRGRLDELAAPEAEDAVTLVSELATNAVLHARTQFTVEVQRRGDVVHVRVHDLSVVLPRQRSYGHESTTGRGIRLVASLASSWGIDPQGAGKAIWFEVAADGSDDALQGWDANLDVAALLGTAGTGEGHPEGVQALASAA